MSQRVEILGFGLQARIEIEGRERTILELLRERMDGVDRVVRRKSLKERLGLNVMSSCCGGATWGLGPNTISVMEDDEEPEIPMESVQIVDPINGAQTASENSPTSPCAGQSPAVTGMNLAAALAAERQFRVALDTDNDSSIPSPSRSLSPTRSNSNDLRNPFSITAENVPATPSRVSLMRLLEETDGYDEVMKHEEDGGGCDSVCCVCMGRKKGAAFIPCGHTFCRVCSREVWLNRGCCPLCNRNIIEILDIY